MSMFHHQPSHRFGGCCRGRHCHCVAVLLYFPALPSRNRFLFWEQNRAVESTSSARSCKKLAGISEKPVVAHQKQKTNPPTLVPLPGAIGDSGSVWSAEASCGWRELGLWRAHSRATSRQLDLSTGLVGSDSVKRQFRWRSRARGSRGRLRRGDCSYLHIGPAASDEAPRC